MSTVKTIVMYFHCAGIVSDEHMEVVEETDIYIALDRGNKESEPWLFSKETGECLNNDNDEAALGCFRTIDPINDRELEKELKKAKADLRKSLATIVRRSGLSNQSTLN